MAKASTKALAIEDDEWRRKVTFDFDNKGTGVLKKPDNFGELAIGDKVTVVLEGTVSSIRADKEDCSFSVTYDELELTFEQKCDSMKDAMDEISGKRKA